MKDEVRPIIRGTLCVVIKDCKYLMRLENGGINDGCWIFPGGSFDDIQGEDRRELGVECATRETQEETGVTPINPILKATMFFDNRYRIFPGKTEVASFDYQGLYYQAEDFEGELKPTHKDCRQGLFLYREAKTLHMHEGDRAILKAIHFSRSRECLDGVIVHEGNKLKLAKIRRV